MNIFELEGGSPSVSQPKLNIFDVKKEKPKDVDISELVAEDKDTMMVDTPETVVSRDTMTTEPTTLALGLSTVDSPVYMTKSQLDEKKQEMYEQASIHGNPYIDPETGENKGMPLEPGLEDVTLESIPFGKLGMLGGNKEIIYDDIAEDFLKPGTRGLNAAANLIAHTKKTTPEEVLKSVEHLPPEDRTIALAMGTKDKKFINHIKMAVGKDSILASRLQDEVVTRKDIIKALGQNKVDLKYAAQKWDEMLDLVNKEPVAYPLGNIADDLKYIDTLYGTQTGKAATIVSKLKLASGNGATINLGEALDLRKGVNRLIRKAPKGTDELKHLINIKTQIDSFIESATKSKPELKDLIKKTQENYARTINNVDLTALINKATSDSGALDYKKLLKTIDKAGLKSPEVTKAVEIAKLFEDKFKLDRHLSNVIVPKASDIDGLGYIGVGTIARWVIDNLTPYNRFFNRSRFKDIAIQKEIKNSIAKSKSIWEFLDKVKANSKVPNDVKESLEKTLMDAKKAAEHKRLEYKPGSESYKEVNLNPLFATKEGTIGTDKTAAVMHDFQREMVQKALGKGYSDEVVDKAYNLMQSKRFEGIINNTRKKLKVEDRNYNIKVVKNIITNEAKQLIDNIERSVGVKLPKQEAEKIIRMKLNQMMKDCE